MCSIQMSVCAWVDVAPCVKRLVGKTRRALYNSILSLGTLNNTATFTTLLI